MFDKLTVIDCRGHLLGRLAATCAKELLNGQKIVCIRTEEINMSGSFMRNKMKYLRFLRKKMNTNPARGPFHNRSPSQILRRAIRGMLPHKQVCIYHCSLWTRTRRCPNHRHVFGWHRCADLPL